MPWQWDDEAYTRTNAEGKEVSFDEYKEKDLASGSVSSPLLSKSEVKLYAITGVGFFLDSYDLFIVNLVSPIWAYEYWGGLEGRKPNYPSLLRGTVNAASNIGNVFGQLAFGFLGDSFGRKFVYGKELIITIIGTILVISLPNSISSPTLKMIWIFCFRVLLGIGIGGDYPISASIVSERAKLHKRGQLLGWIFSNQGWGTLTGSVATIIILAIFSKALKAGEYNQLDAVWRIQIGIALVPAFATLWPRLTMPEGKKYLESLELNKSNRQDSEEPTLANGDTATSFVAPGVLTAPRGRKARLSTFFVYFSEWRHLKTLLGTMSCWFLLDVAFYGVNLNQSVILTEIGFATGDTEYDVLFRNAIGNLIIAVTGYVPGYFFTIYFVEKLGRRWIQIQGFLIVALMFGILAGDYKNLGTAPKFVLFALAQFFFNFGPNATTFIIPAEVFPSRVRGFAHGLSAATGKMGAILSSLLFNYLSGPKVIGLANVLWIFFACNLLGAIITFFTIPETKLRDADVVDFQEYQEAQLKRKA